MVWRIAVLGLGLALGACAAGAVSANPPAPVSPSHGLTFSLNVQDFAYPEQSIALLHQLIDLHEAHEVPVDVFLTDWMVEIYERQAPELLERLKASRVVAVSYHTRAPKPYRVGFDWLGLARQSPAQQYQQIWNYETHDLDLTTGQPLATAGGYARLKELLGYAPYMVGAAADAAVEASVLKVFADMGAQMAVVHGNAVNVGERKLGLWLKPEHYDLRLFEHLGRNPQQVLQEALQQASAAPRAKAPYLVGVKMHDNDFLAERSAWLTVYGQDKRPPWDPSQKAALLSPSQQEAMWQLYAQTVAYAASLRSQLRLLNAPQLLALQTQ